jgi:hypothetical protein
MLTFETSDSSHELEINLMGTKKYLSKLILTYKPHDHR